MIREDHDRVRSLFREYEGASDDGQKMQLAEQIITALDVHAGIEEEIFYPAFETEAEADNAEELVAEAEEEHHVAHVLIDELKAMPEFDQEYEAKFAVLMENVQHHMEEEEKEMLPRAKKLGDERLAELAGEMQTRKAELQEEFGAEMGMEAEDEEESEEPPERARRAG